MSETNSTQEETPEQDERQLTPEEYAKARADATAHLKKEIAFLKVEKEYEIILADIEEAKTRRISMIAQQARFYAPKNPEATSGPQGESEVPQGSDSDIDRNIAPVPKRKLKTEA